ncbi:hypothetical protein Kpol_1003p32 [Vanderwaltozyma polyspora DSM 70294]|uniref:Phosphatidylinositol N-acetylglucosaminyltransferase subunit H conserved domain-containing protein n=1 Tax=Vanderwaltozyma polyspora (strain ATCC 22028 / DSM 70294 / BCRC 21397 / CBS 2163 / NBRC 10782 / NRRL Y-8283 / UCD 57-17) TaxID=436907 RepID=A7TLZ0_VANPO|nr:uncharacterized protein Kpol_1003p32 [Vanderwaltozyma polyspora DSM 70294]EDO16727.1 hypothetical protein Kpol_1003p32 [Vanderwaltozyma polyspora DSM 70294]
MVKGSEKTSSSFQRKQEKKYILTIQELANKKCIRFTVEPTGYAIKTIKNIFLIILIVYLSLYYSFRYIDLDGYLKWLYCAFVISIINFKIRAPTVSTFTVLKDHGVQISNISGWNCLPFFINKLWFVEYEFIPRNEVVDIIINEGFQPGFQVVFYLALIVKKQEKLKLIFPVCIRNLLFF